MKMVMFVFGIFVSAWLSAATETTWTGAGADKLTSTAANWSDEADLTDGSVTANFASSGSEALVAGCLSLYGIGFDAGGAFTLGAADGNAKLALGAGGIATAGTGPYALSVPVEIAADQTWNIGKALNITSSVVQSPSSSYTLTKQGSGELSFSGGRELGGNIDVKAGALTLIGENPAGDADIALNKGSSMTLKGAVVNNRITVDPKGGWDANMAINVPKGYGDSRINGEVTVRYGNFYTKIEASDDAQNKLVFAGGLRCSGGADDKGKEYPDGGYAYFQVDGGGVDSISCPVIEFSSPLALNNRTFYVVPKNINKLGFAGEFVFSAPGNEIKYLGYHSADSKLLLKNCKVKTTVDGAFDNANMTIRCDYNMEWDLCGTEQSVGFIRSTHIAHRAAVITNSHEKFATLRFNHSTSDWTNKVVFAGNLNVEMSGAKKLAIDSPVPAKGDLAVNGGTMEFFADGSWRSARTVTVAGSGRITAVSGNVFSESAVLSLANGNSFAIAAGEDGAVVT